MKKIRKANLGMSFNGPPLDSADWTTAIPSGLYYYYSSRGRFKGHKVPKYTLLPDQGWLSWQGPQLEKYKEDSFPDIEVPSDPIKKRLEGKIDTPSYTEKQTEDSFPDIEVSADPIKKRLKKKIDTYSYTSRYWDPSYKVNQNNLFDDNDLKLTYNSPESIYQKILSRQLEQYGPKFGEKNFPLHMGNLLRFTGNKDLQEYGNKLWERGREQTNFNAPSVQDLAKYGSKAIRSSLLNETPVGKKFNTDELNNAYSSLGEYGDAAVRLGHSLGVGIGGEWGDAVSKAATGALVTTNAIKNLKKLKGVKGQNVAKAGNAAAIAGAVSDVASSFLPEKTEYAGDKGDVTETIDTIYDGVSNAAMAFGPIGMLVGGAMKTASLLGKGFNALGGGTDGKTTQDAILGSSLFNWNVGLINGFGGSRAETITKDEDVQAKIGSGYLGSYNKIDRALADSGAKYGLFSSASRRHANNRILEARRQQNILTDIADYATDRFDIRNSMAAINGNKRRFQMQGGYNQSAISVGRNGMVIKDLQRAKRITSSMKYQKGGKVSDPYQSYLQTLPEYQRDDSNFRVRDYWEFNGRPKDFNEAISKGMFTQYKDGWHAKSVAENPKTGEIEYMKSSNHPTRYMESDWYEKGLVYDEDENGNIISTKLSPGVDGYDDWLNFTKNYELQKTEPYWKYVKRKGTDQPQSFKEGGNLTNQLVELDFNSISDEFRGIDEIDINNISLEFRGIDEVNLDSIPLEFRGIDEIDINNILPEFKEGGNLTKKSRTLEELIEYAKQQNPRFVQRMSEPIKDIDLGNGERGTHRLSYGEVDGRTIVYPEIFEGEDGELIFDPKNAVKHALDNKDFLEMSPEEAELFTADNYKQGWPEFFQKYLQGGKFNLIPEGALHARKHNMDVEGITKKGIPVVSESPDGKLEQQAEIEREEIILRLEVTKKIEELAKDGSDEAAIEAGKLLVKEILYNTVDNTNSLI